jgi:hypothetical protein
MSSVTNNRMSGSLSVVLGKERRVLSRKTRAVDKRAIGGSSFVESPNSPFKVLQRVYREEGEAVFLGLVANLLMFEDPDGNQAVILACNRRADFLLRTNQGKKGTK